MVARVNSDEQFIHCLSRCFDHQNLHLLFWRAKCAKFFEMLCPSLGPHGAQMDKKLESWDLFLLKNVTKRH